MKAYSVRKARRTVKLKLRKGDVKELDELAEWMREEGFEHADREVALEALLREFFRSGAKASRDFREWLEESESGSGEEDE